MNGAPSHEIKGKPHSGCEADTFMNTRAELCPPHCRLSYVLTFMEPLSIRAYAYSAASIRRADHNLVGHGFCKDSVGGISGYLETPCG